MKDTRINLRVDPKLKAMLQAAADSEHRTLSNYITWLLTDMMEKQNAPYDKDFWQTVADYKDKP